MFTSNSFLPSLLNSLAGLFGRSSNSPSPSPRAIKMITDGNPEPMRVLSPRVLVVVFDPILDRTTGRRLLQAPETAHWSRVDDLLAGYIADVDECSGGLVKYQIAERLTVDNFPVKEDRFTYDAASYWQALRTGRYHAPDWMDYGHLLTDLQLLQRVDQGDVMKYGSLARRALVSMNHAWQAATRFGATRRRVNTLKLAADGS